MIPYIFIIFFLIVLRIFIFNKWCLSNRDKRIYIWLALTPITVISAFRSDKIGADTFNYKMQFQEIVNGNEMVERIEIGFVYLNKLLAYFTTEFQWLVVITAVFLSISIGIFIYRNAKDPFLAILFFVTLGLYQFSLSGIRQSLAISIIIFSYELIKKKKLIWFLVLIFVAYFFHKSAILFLPAYFIAHRHVTIKNLTFFSVIFISLFYFAEYLLLFTADVLNLDYGIEDAGNGEIFFIIVLIITFLGFLNRKVMIFSKMKGKTFRNKSNIVFLNINYISLLLWGIRLVSRTAERVTFYYMPSTYIVLEEFVSTIKNKNKKIIVYIIVSILSISLFIYRISYDDTFIPYRFYK